LSIDKRPEHAVNLVLRIASVGQPGLNRQLHFSSSATGLGKGAAMKSAFSDSTASFESLQERLQSGFAAGHIVHGSLGLSLADYIEHVLAVVCKFVTSGDDQARTDFLGRLHTCDLYLAAGCSRRSERAWLRFDQLYSRYLNDVVRCLCPIPRIVDDLTDSFLVDLFLPDRSGNCRISSYDGRSSLTTWLRVVVANRVINERQHKRNSAYSPEPGIELVDHSAQSRLETQVIQNRYEYSLDQALRNACQTLSTAEKRLLLLRFEKQCQLSQIARATGVHQSTITRMLERIARKFRQQVIDDLGRQALHPAAIEECLNGLLDQPAHSLSVLGMIRLEALARTDPSRSRQDSESIHTLPPKLETSIGRGPRKPCRQAPPVGKRAGRIS
jgi:RNA polymerase sigma-70 factor